MVEQWSPKPKVKGSNPFSSCKVLVAQWIERRTTDSEVESSSLSEHV